MSVDITIERSFGEKAVPLSVILGDELRYGRYMYDRLEEGKLDEDGCLVVYDPQHIGRGFAVFWNPEGTKSVHFRMWLPASREDIQALFSAVSRVMEQMHGRLIIDGRRHSLKAFMNSMPELLKYNESVLDYCYEEMLGGKSEPYYMFSAKWPLLFGLEEAKLCHHDVDALSRWLHEKQSVPAKYSAVRAIEYEEEYLAVCEFSSDQAYIFPKDPTIFVTDERTAKRVNCTIWSVLLELKGDKKNYRMLDFDRFLQRIPKDRMTDYDLHHCLISALSTEELTNLFGL